MPEGAGRLFPARRAGILLLILWLLSAAGIIFFAGAGIRSVCGSVFSAVLLWLCFLDLRDGMLYDCITLPFAAAGLLCAAAGLVPVADALIGGTLCGVLFYCLYIAARGGLGGAAAAVLLLTRRKRRQEGIPFGPFLAAGGYIAFIAGEQLWHMYWGLM